jgi:hypothetical protein
MSRLPLGYVRDGAGVDDEGIGGSGAVRNATPRGGKLLRHRLRFRLVQLAADGKDSDVEHRRSATLSNVFENSSFYSHALIITDDEGMSTQVGPTGRPSQEKR